MIPNTEYKVSANKNRHIECFVSNDENLIKTAKYSCNNSLQLFSRRNDVCFSGFLFHSPQYENV